MYYTSCLMYSIVWYRDGVPLFFTLTGGGVSTVSTVSTKRGGSDRTILWGFPRSVLWVFLYRAARLNVSIFSVNKNGTIRILLAKDSRSAKRLSYSQKSRRAYVTLNVRLPQARPLTKRSARPPAVNAADCGRARRQLGHLIVEIRRRVVVCHSRALCSYTRLNGFRAVRYAGVVNCNVGARVVPLS